MVLVTFNDNYADEFDCDGFSVYNSKEEFLIDLYRSWLENIEDIDDDLDELSLEELIKLEKKHRKTNEFEMYFGTNEAFYYNSFKDYKDAFEIKEITDDEYKVIKKLFLGNSYSNAYGFFPISY